MTKKNLTELNELSKENIPSEEWEQKQIFIWARGHQIESPDLRYLNGSMNGVKLSKHLSKKAKEQGMNKGYLDINLPMRSGGYSGLYIELKRIKGGKVSKDQKRWKAYLISQGYKAIVCRGHKEAIEEIKIYMETF